ncbi:MAG: alpha/beta hydrolase [Microcoleaceae cyanobacterium]
MKSIDINGIQQIYQLTQPVSASPTLVFIHGWLLSRQYWQPVMAGLSSDYQCLSYDLRGFGQSQLRQNQTSSQQDYTPAAYAEDILLLLEKLNLSSVWLVGHSLGGTIALLAAQKQPQRVQGVVCINAGGGIYLEAEFKRFRAAGEQIVKFRPPWLSRIPGLDLLFTRTQVSRPLQRSWGRQRIVDFIAANPDAALKSLLDSTTEAEVKRLPEVVSQLQQPVYFLAGKQDKVMELQYVYHLAKFHWLSQQGKDNVIEIPNCGHMAMLEQTDIVITHLKTILANYSKINQ